MNLIITIHIIQVNWNKNIMAKKESSIKSFVLRVDSETMEAIEQWAADEFRSTNGQLQWIINEALRKSGRLKKTRKERVTDDEKD